MMASEAGVLDSKDVESNAGESFTTDATFEYTAPHVDPYNRTLHVITNLESFMKVEPWLQKTNEPIESEVRVPAVSPVNESATFQEQAKRQESGELVQESRTSPDSERHVLVERRDTSLGGDARDESKASLSAPAQTRVNTERNWSSVLRPRRTGGAVPETTSVTTASQEIKAARSVTRSYLYTNLARDIDHVADGATHLEFTDKGWNIINDKLAADGAFSSKLVRFMDLGAGYGSYLASTAQQYDGEFYGVELEEQRCYGFGAQFLNLLCNTKDAAKLKNYRIKVDHKNIMDMAEYKADVVYSFDAAFPVHVHKRIVKTWLDSPRPKYLVITKPGKSMKGAQTLRNNLLANCKLVFEGFVPDKGGHDVKVLIVKKKGPVEGRPASESPWPNTIAFASEHARALKEMTGASLMEAKNARSGRTARDLNEMQPCLSENDMACPEIMGCKACQEKFTPHGDTDPTLLCSAASPLGGKGLFVQPGKEIKQDTPIIEVKGRNVAIPNEYGIKVGDHYLKPTNICKFVNHSCRPSCKLYKWVSADEEERVMIVSLTHLKGNTEITIDKEHPFGSAGDSKGKRKRDEGTNGKRNKKKA